MIVYFFFEFELDVCYYEYVNLFFLIYFIGEVITWKSTRYCLCNEMEDFERREVVGEGSKRTYAFRFKCTF